MGEGLAVAVVTGAVLTALGAVALVLCYPLWPVLKRVLVAYAGLNRWLWYRISRRRAPAALPAPEVWCTCGSQAAGVPVEVHDGPDGAPEVVGHLCPDCREKRRPTTPKAQRKALRDPLPDWAKGYVREPEPVRVPGPYDADPAPPVVEIEQGGWIYALGWHVEIEDLCADDDHEWETLRGDGEVCATCGVKRRRVCEHDWEEFEVHSYGSSAPVRTFRQCLRCRIER